MTEHNLPTEEEQNDAVIGTAFRWSLMVIVVIAGTSGAGYWWWTQSTTTPVEKQTLLTAPKQTVPPVNLPIIKFTDITQQAGITFKHENGAKGQKLLPETMGGGCAFLDYDNDGDQDLLFVNSNRWPWDQTKDQQPVTMALYQNDGTGKFKNVTTGSGLDVSFYGMGVACGDYNNDGLVDVFLSALGPNHLFQNLGDGQFQDVTASANVAGAETEWSTSCGWFDYDRDGDLDLLVLNYLDWSAEDDRSKPFQLTGGGRAYGRPQDFGETQPYLYRNEGNGKFIEVAKKVGLHKITPTNYPMAKSLGLAFADLDLDGWLDVIVANDTVQNFLFHNRQNGHFKEVGRLSGVAFDSNGLVRGAMGIDVGQFRKDGSLGIAIGNFANEMTALYVSDGKHLNFVDQAFPSGLKSTRQDLTFGVFFFDPDLDGRLDIFSANGHLEEDIQKVQASQYYEQPPQLLWNCGITHAVEFCPLDESSIGKEFLKPIVGRGAAYADIDNDGDQDVVITASGWHPRLLRNDQQQEHHWVRFKLQGTACNRDAIGARITLTLTDRTLTQQVMPTRSYLSQVELPVTFGLERVTLIPKVEIQWPDGTRQVLEHVQGNQLHHIVQPRLK